MKSTMNPKYFAMFLVVFFLCAAMVPRTEAGHKLKLKKIAKMLLMMNALTGKKILFPLPLPLPIPIFQEHIKHIPYEMKEDYGMGGYGDMGGGYGGMGGGYGGGMVGGHGGGFGGGMGGGYGGGGGGMKGGFGGGGFGGGMGGGYGGGGMKGGGGGGGGWY